MSEILNKNIVLMLNRNWQAINIRTPQEAFCQMATNVATALEIQGEDYIRPVQWDEWITLPIHPQDSVIEKMLSVLLRACGLNTRGQPNHQLRNLVGKLKQRP